MRLTAFLMPLVLCLCAGLAAAEQRIALVVGNGDYAAVQHLDNPVADARLLADTLAGVGFEVTLVTDAGQTAMKRAIRDFGQKLRAAGPEATGLFYYAGHGVQSFGTNYILPVDSVLTDAADLSLAGIEAETILRQMASAHNRTNIFILDACRNNPFQNIRDFGDNGLAEMKAPTGTFLAYATAPGTVALDGIGANSPFTAALARNLTRTGAPIEQVFRDVRVEVLSVTNGMQTPWDTSSLTNEFSFVPARPMTSEELAEQQLWDSVRLLRDPVQVMLFLRAYPDSRFEAEARALLAEAMQAEIARPLAAPGPAVPPSPPAASQAQAPSPASAPTQPDAEEQALIAQAQGTGAVEYYEAYLARFPDGVFAELARIEVEAHRAKLAAAAAAAAAAAPQVAAIAPPPPPAAAKPVAGTVGFLLPLASDDPVLAGKTIEELTLGSPLFPPIEGLPESYWKGKTCSNCHEWTRDALCTQASTYLGANAARSLGKQHPYGGSFKQVLRAWASDGCS